LRLLYMTQADPDDLSYGGAQRSAYLLDALRRVAEVDTLTIHGGPATSLQAQWDGSRVRRLVYDVVGTASDRAHARWQVRDAVARSLQTGDYDFVVARYFGLTGYLPLRSWRDVVLDADDIVKSPLAQAVPSAGRRAKLWARNAAARWSLPRFAHRWFVNPAEMKRFVHAADVRSSLLPNVVPLPAPQRPRPAPVPGRILMIGYFEHPPNEEGLRWFAAQVLPALRARFGDGVHLRAVGKHADALATTLPTGVELAGYVPTLAQEYDAASLVVAPVLSGGGTQIKVLEALAHERPLVASAFAHSGFADELADREHLAVADDAAAWIERCAQALADPAPLQAAARRGAEVVAQQFGPERMMREVAATFDSLAAERAR
jgi:hypothetical protein